MKLNHIVLHADSSEAFSVRAEIAVNLAKSTGARLSVIFKHPRGSALRAEFAGPGELWENYRQFLWGKETECRNAFNALVDGDVPVIEWTHALSNAAREIQDAARFADCIILGQSPRRSGAEHPSIEPGDVLESAPCPCLIVPEKTQPDWSFEHIGIAWNDSREAASAVRNCMAWIRGARTVSVVTIGEHIDTAALEQYLEDEKIDFTIARIGAMPGISEAACIDDWAETEHVDLVVQGAYGRRRGYELLFGSMTRSMLAGSRTPVLMKH